MCVQRDGEDSKQRNEFVSEVQRCSHSWTIVNNYFCGVEVSLFTKERGFHFRAFSSILFCAALAHTRPIFVSCDYSGTPKNCMGCCLLTIHNLMTLFFSRSQR